MERTLSRRRPPVREGRSGLVGAIASRLGGSADIYEARGQTPENSINFVTVHDGFTLNDLVSYNDKHNEANGEGNRDGINDNLSWNCGVEGPTGDPAIEALRARQIKNVVTILMLSRGVPMMLGGDEIRRTQERQQQRVQPGQRDQLVRLDAAPTSHTGLLRFVQRMIAFRKAHPALSQPHFYTGEIQRAGPAGHHLARHGVGQSGLRRPAGRVLACTIAGFDGSRRPARHDEHVLGAGSTSRCPWPGRQLARRDRHVRVAATRHRDRRSGGRHCRVHRARTHHRGVGERRLIYSA